MIGHESWRPLLASEDLPLGVDSAATFQPAVEQWSPTGLFAMYADGLTETVATDGDWLGHPRLADELARAKPATAHTAAEYLFNFVDQFQGDDGARDDCALLIARLA